MKKYIFFDSIYINIENYSIKVESIVNKNFIEVGVFLYESDNSNFPIYSLTNKMENFIEDDGRVYVGSRFLDLNQAKQFLEKQILLGIKDFIEDDGIKILNLKKLFDSLNH